MPVWEISLYYWLIDDGAYDHFFEGQTVEFATVLDPKRVRKSPGTVAEAHSLGAANYSLAGQIVYAKDGLRVVDFGLRASIEILDAELTVGNFVEIDARLCVDPYGYNTPLHNHQEMPCVVHTFNILAIELYTAPWVRPADANGPQSYIIDESRTAHERVPDTRSRPTLTWQSNAPDGFLTWCVLHCEQLAVPPKRTSITALSD